MSGIDIEKGKSDYAKTTLNQKKKKKHSSIDKLNSVELLVLFCICIFVFKRKIFFFFIVDWVYEKNRNAGNSVCLKI